MQCSWKWLSTSHLLMEGFFQASPRNQLCTFLTQREYIRKNFSLFCSQLYVNQTPFRSRRYSAKSGSTIKMHVTAILLAFMALATITASSTTVICETCVIANCPSLQEVYLSSATIKFQVLISTSVNLVAVMADHVSMYHPQ
jgi:hypothetical protein